MKASHQFQDFGSELLEQPRDVIWLEAETPVEEKVMLDLCRRIEGTSVKAGLTGIHALKPEKYNDLYPKTFIFSLSHRK